MIKLLLVNCLIKEDYGYKPINRTEQSQSIRCASICLYADLCSPATNAMHLAGSTLRFDLLLAPCPKRPYALCSHSLVRVQPKRRRKRINLMMYLIQHCIIMPMHQRLVNPINDLNTIILVHTPCRDSCSSNTNT